MKKIFCGFVALVATLPVWAIKGTITNDAGKTFEGDIHWQQSSKTYAVSYRKGSTEVSAEVKLEGAKLEIPEPPELANLRKLVEAGNGAAAVARLEELVKRYRMLVWDKEAGACLVRALVDRGTKADVLKAIELAEEIIRGDKTAAYSGSLAVSYWDALLKAGASEKLEKCLRQAASSGERASSAEALVMRGNIILAGGESVANLRKALTDSYLRVAFMYRDRECVAARQDALQRAAACLEKLGDAERAEALRSEARQL